MTDTNYTGGYIAIAAIVAGLLAKLGISVEAQSLVDIVAGALALLGIIKQLIDHKNQGVALSTAKSIARDN